MKRLIKYTHERKHNLIHLLGADADSYTDETFHELRVEIKRIRFLAWLAQFAGKRPRKNNLKELNKIFYKAGIIRNKQITQQIVSKLSDKKLPEKIKELLTEKTEKKKAGFFKGLDKSRMSKVKQQLQKLEKQVKKISTGDLNKFQHKLEDEFMSIQSKKKLAIKDIHALRKILKPLSYSYKVSAGKADKTLASIEKLSDIIGGWHDYLISMKEIKKIIKAIHLTSSDKLLFEKVIYSLKRKETAASKKIMLIIRENEKQ